MKLDTKTILILTFEPDEVTSLKRAIDIALDNTTQSDSPALGPDDIDFLSDLFTKL